MQNQDNQQLFNKYQNSYSFRSQMIKISDKFKEFQQQALYSELEESSKSMIISITPQSQLSSQLKPHPNMDYFIIIGAKQPHNSLEKIILNIIHLIPRPSSNYTIIYINTCAHNNAFNDFMSITDFLPIDYFMHLDKMYVLHASFLNKAMNWVSFNAITSLMRAKTVYINSFHELAEEAHLDEIQFLNVLPTQIKCQLARIEQHVHTILNKQHTKTVTKSGGLKQVKVEKPQYLQSTKSQPQMNQNKEQSKPPSKSPIFSSSMKKNNKCQLQAYEMGQTGAPIALQMMIYYFNERDECLNTEGIFRKSVSIDDQTQFLAEIHNQNYDYIENMKDPHIIANGIKRFISNLITPLIPYAHFQKLMDSTGDNITTTTISSIKSLSELRRHTLLILFQFFLEKVIPKEHQNKMSLNNICIVIGPCIMRSEVSSIKDLIYSQKIVCITAIIIKQFDSIFGNKKERVQAIRQSAKNYNKAYVEDRLGRYESDLDLSTLQPCSLTISQTEVVSQSKQKLQKKTQQQSQTFNNKQQSQTFNKKQQSYTFKKKQQSQTFNNKQQSQTFSNKVKMWQRISMSMKEEIALNEDQNNEDEFYDISAYQVSTTQAYQVSIKQQSPQKGAIIQLNEDEFYDASGNQKLIKQHIPQVAQIVQVKKINSENNQTKHPDI